MEVIGGYNVTSIEVFLLSQTHYAFRRKYADEGRKTLYQPLDKSSLIFIVQLVKNESSLLTADGLQEVAKSYRYFVGDSPRAIVCPFCGANKFFLVTAEIKIQGHGLKCDDCGFVQIYPVMPSQKMECV